MKAKGIWDLAAGKFAENITTEGIELYTLPVGTKLKVGEEVILEISQIGKKCHEACEIRKITGDCIMPKEGVFARVLKSGFIKPGDEIIVING
jgi:MOSC domain-containing protein YiiM